MKHIRQKHKTSCGIACVAMAANIDEDTAVKYVLPKRKKYTEYGTYPRELVSGLARLGYKAKRIFRYKQKIADLKSNAIILLLNREDKFHHAVMWNARRQEIFDPDSSVVVKLNRKMVPVYMRKPMTAKKYYESYFHSYITFRK
jgi:ABC-type bacteriocin/lantibiotic exporter with double-glycine peptidase domain